MREEPIVITGWTPHYVFEAHDLKLLEDPQNILGYEEDMPEAYAVLEKFSWTVKDMQTVMVDTLDVDFEEASENWIADNRGIVDSWIEGDDEVDGESLGIVSFPWDTERASSQVISLVLEEIGYDVMITNVDSAILIQALATGESDTTVAVWLPIKQGFFVEEHENELDDLGINLTGTQVGFIVPEYVDIDSIEDLPVFDQQ